MKTFLVTYSPTRTSFKVGEAILNGIDSDRKVIDLTREEFLAQVIPEDSLVIFSVPVYGGHIAPTAVKRIKNIRSNGALAAAVVVYGNRDYEKALAELDEILKQNGFKVIGGATFVGEHSYSTGRFPIAAGRPNSDDLQQASAFGKRLQEKIESGNECPEEVDVRNIVRPHTSPVAKLRFIISVLTKIKKAKKSMSRTPLTDAALCIHCGKCVRVCPTEAIAQGDECHTSLDKCTRCCACVKSCPQGARTYATPFSQVLSKNFRKPQAPHTLL